MRDESCGCLSALVMFKEVVRPLADDGCLTDLESVLHALGAKAVGVKLAVVVNVPGVLVHDLAAAVPLALAFVDLDGGRDPVLPFSGGVSMQALYRCAKAWKDGVRRGRTGAKDASSDRERRRIETAVGRWAASPDADRWGLDRTWREVLASVKTHELDRVQRAERDSRRAARALAEHERMVARAMGEAP